MWEYDLGVAAMVSQVIEKRRAPFLRWRAPIKLRKRIEALRKRHPESEEFLREISKIFDRIEELMNLVERLREASRS